MSWIAIHHDEGSEYASVSEMCPGPWRCAPLDEERENWFTYVSCEPRKVTPELAFDDGSEVGYFLRKARGKDKGRIVGRAFYSYGTTRRGTDRAWAAGIPVTKSKAIIDAVFKAHGFTHAN